MDEIARGVEIHRAKSVAWRRAFKGGEEDLKPPAPKEEPRGRPQSAWQVAPSLPVHLLGDEAQSLLKSSAQEWRVCDAAPLGPGLGEPFS